MTSTLKSPTTVKYAQNSSAKKSVVTVPEIMTEEDPKKPIYLNSPEKVTKEKTLSVSMHKI